MGISRPAELELGARVGPRGSATFIPDSSALYAYIRDRIVAYTGEAECDSIRRRTHTDRAFGGMVVQDSAREVFQLLYVTKDLGCEVVPLDLSKVPSYALFSGQVVKVVGKNHLGNEITVHEIDLATDIELFSYPGVRQPFSFSTIVFGKERFFIDWKKIKTDLALIIGDLSAEERKECRAAAGPQTKLVFVPPIGGLHTSMVFPTWFAHAPQATATPSMETLDLSAAAAIDATNPTVLYVNGVSIGVCTYDTLSDIYLLTKTQGCQPRTQDMLKHIVFQKAFLLTVPRNTPVDYTAREHLMHPHMLDILVVMSKLTLPPTQVDYTYLITAKPGVHSFSANPGSGAGGSGGVSEEAVDGCQVEVRPLSD